MSLFLRSIRDLFFPGQPKTQANEEDKDMKPVIKNKQGQAMTEYIIIVVVIALAALVIFGLFGDRIRQMVGGAVKDLGGDEGEVDSATDTKSADYLKTLGTE